MCLSGVRVLLAEDNPTNQLVATQMLESLGATVTLARDGAEALEILEDQEFDVMLVDIEMPRVNGIDVIRRTRASSGSRAELPMIALTAYVMREHRAAIDAAGADGIVAKPILSVQQLGEDIRRFMRKRIGPAAEASRGDADAAGSVGPVIDPAVYDSLSQAIGSSAMSELLGKVETDVQSAHARLTRALETGDLDEIRSASHILISVSGAIGAVQVEMGAKQLNAAAHRGEAAALERVASGLFEEIERMLESVRARMKD